MEFWGYSAQKGVFFEPIRGIIRLIVVFRNKIASAISRLPLASDDYLIKGILPNL